MHDWSDETVDWKGIDDAAWYIGGGLARWARIGVTQIKEKYGTVRVYCSFGFNSFYEIWRPRHVWIPSWWPWKLDRLMTSFLLDKLNIIIVPLQKKYYAHQYAKAVRKWPHLYNEIVSCADFGELFDGIVPGYKHSNYWQQFQNDTETGE